MPEFVVDPLRLGASLTEDAARRFEGVVGAMRRTVKLNAPRIAQALIRSVQPHQPVDRATYRRSFAEEDVPNGVVFYNFAKHAPIIELGRRPGRMPPLQVILDWVRRKKIGAAFFGPVQEFVGPMPRGQKAPNQRQLRRLEVERQQERIALSIARAIKARGLPARLVLARTEEFLTPLVVAAIEEAMGG